MRFVLMSAISIMVMAMANVHGRPQQPGFFYNRGDFNRAPFRPPNSNYPFQQPQFSRANYPDQRWSNNGPPAMWMRQQPNAGFNVPSGNNGRKLEKVEGGKMPPTDVQQRRQQCGCVDQMRCFCDGNMQQYNF